METPNLELETLKQLLKQQEKLASLGLLSAGIGQWCVFSILPKFAVDFVFLGIASWKLKSKRRMFAFLPVELIQIPMIVFAVPAGITGMFRWK